MAGDGQGDVSAIVAALSAGRLDDSWPEHLQLRDALDELTRWLRDDHQWGAQNSAPHWQSLIRDGIDALRELGPHAQGLLDAQDASAELGQCKAAFGSKAKVTDPALRERLTICAGAITRRAASAVTVLAAWEDLVESIHDRDVAARLARALMSLASWIGHDARWLVGRITRALDGWEAMRIDGELVSPETDVPIEERLSAARAVLAAAPARTDMTVWLRFRLARLSWPPVIAIGEAIRIYRGDWLRNCLCAPQPHQRLPHEATGQDRQALHRFCGVQPAEVEAGGRRHDPHEVPIAYIRVVVADDFAARAVDIARSNAEALAALGALYGEEPTIWRLDRSWQMFSGDRDAGCAQETEEPEWTDSVVVAEDQTAEILRQSSQRLAAHVPFRDRELEEAMVMVGWLRRARAAPPAARLVLCDRVIEAVCGWVGKRDRAKFVRDNLIPWWAHSRFVFLATKVAHQLVHTHGSARLQADDQFRAAWEEILRHPPLIGLGSHPAKLKTSTLVAEVPWLLERVPLDSALGRSLGELERRTRTGASALSYWDAWCKCGERIELRRARTRNAIIHGGPLAPATVASVALFAERIASRALSTSLDATLAGQTISSHFNAQDARIVEMRRRLCRGDPPADVVFGDLR